MEDIITFQNFGLDFDTQKDLVGVGRSEYYLNCEEYGNKGVISNIKGNTKVEFTLPSGTNICIGSCNDPENNCIYYFIKNTFTSQDTLRELGSGIFKFDIANNYIEPVIQELFLIQPRNPITGFITVPNYDFLNFDADYKIINSKVTDGLLYWTDNNAPRKLNIELATNYMRAVNSGGYYGIIRAEQFGSTVSQNQYPVLDGSYTSNEKWLYEILNGGITGFVSWRKFDLSVYNPTFVLLGTADDGFPLGIENGRIHIFSTTNADYDIYSMYQYHSLQNKWVYLGLTTDLDWSAYTNPLLSNTNNSIDDTGLIMSFDTPSYVPSSFMFCAIYTPMYFDIDADMLTVIKRPPISAPLVSYTTEPINYNNLKGHVWKVAYRYQYEDNEYSVYSDHSIVQIPQGETDVFNTDQLALVQNIFTNNNLNITVNTGNDNVKNIEIIFKAGENNDWFTGIEIIKKDSAIQNNVEHTTSFKNDGLRETIVQEDALIQYDYVPQLAGQQEIIQDGRIVYGDITEGYPNTPLDVTVEYRNIPQVLVNGTLKDVELKSETQWISNSGQYLKLEWWRLSSTTWFSRTFDTKEYYTISMPDRSRLTSTSVVMFSIQDANTNLWNTVSVPMSVSLYDDTDYPNLLVNACVTAIKTAYPSLVDENLAVIKINKPDINTNVGGTTDVYVRNRQNHDFDTYYGGSGTSKDKIFLDNTFDSYPDGTILLLLESSERDVTAWITGQQNALSYKYDPYKHKFAFVSLSIVNVLGSVTYKQWKRHSYRQFGIVYEDDYDRSGGVNTTDSMKLYIDPFLNLYSPTNTNKQFGYVPLGANGLNYLNDVKISINHPVPLWANTYKIVATKNQSILSYIKFRPTQVFVLGSHKILIDFNGAIVSEVTNNPKFNKGAWVWQKGDRIAIISRTVTVGAINVSLPFVSYHDYEIEGIKTESQGTAPIITITGGFVVSMSDNSDFTIADLTATAAQDFLMEVYRPNNTTSLDETYYVLGKYPIINPHTNDALHGKGDDGIDGTLAVDQLYNGTTFDYEAATMYLKGAEAYLKLREMPYSVEPFTIVEDTDVSDYYDSDVHDYGKPYGIIPNAERKRNKSLLRWGQRHIPNTLTNGMSTFLYSSYDTLSDKFGAITGLREVEDTLKIIQEKKLSSRYLSKATFRSANISGSNLVATVTDVLGDLNISAEPYGTQNPESVEVWGRHLYFYDGASGTFVRDTNNGMFPISKYGMNKYFQQLSTEIKALQEPSKIKCYTQYDEKKNYLYVTFKNEGEESFTDRTLVFYEVGETEGTRWIGQVSFTPEMYGSYGNTLVSFVNGELWNHDTNALHNNFYGSQDKMVATVIANKNPLAVKAYTNIALNTNLNKVGWISDSIKTAISNQYTLGMFSKIKRFISKEGKLFANFMRDANTDKMKSETHNLNNGQVLKGEYLEVQLENESDEQVILKSVVINSFESKVG